MSCPDCGGTGRIVIDVPIPNNPYDVGQAEVDCRCNPPATDDDAPPWAEDYGMGPVDWAELARKDRQMNRERAVALFDLGEPPFRDNSYEGL